MDNVDSLILTGILLYRTFCNTFLSVLFQTDIFSAKHTDRVRNSKEIIYYFAVEMYIEKPFIKRKTFPLLYSILVLRESTSFH